MSEIKRERIKGQRKGDVQANVHHGEERIESSTGGGLGRRFRSLRGKFLILVTGPLPFVLGRRRGCRGRSRRRSRAPTRRSRVTVVRIRGFSFWKGGVSRVLEDYGPFR